MNGEANEGRRRLDGEDGPVDDFAVGDHGRIHGQINLLEDQIRGLDGAINRLITKITPVLGPSLPEPGETRPKEPMDSSTMHKILHDYTSVLGEIQATVEAVCERVEL